MTVGDNPYGKRHVVFDEIDLTKVPRHATNPRYSPATQREKDASRSYSFGRCRQS